MKNLLNEIDIINKNNYQFVNFNYFLINDRKNTIKKIILVNLYKFDFWFESNLEYFNKNIDFIDKNILKSELNTSNFEQLYINLFSYFYNDKNLGYRTRIQRNMSANNDEWKIGQVYTDYRFIIKELNILINNYNKNKNEHVLTRLYKLIIFSLSKIHPFSDNNFWTISLLFDLLLVKNWYLPIWLKKTFKDNKIFLPDEEDFYKIILQRYRQYNY